MTTMRTEKAIRREYARVMRACNETHGRSDRIGNIEAINQELVGARQALAWALGENALEPVRSAAPHLPTLGRRANKFPNATEVSHA